MLKEKIKKESDIHIARIREIVDACEKLYKTMSFKDITIKDIASKTSFTRASIYNYFETKEEIFLALYEREYFKWNEDLEKVLSYDKKLTKKIVADKIGKTLSKRIELLKLMAMNNYDMEANSRLECLTNFKVAYLTSIYTFQDILKKYNDKYTKKDLDELTYLFFPFIYALYPYTHVTSKQKKAMDNAGHKWQGNTVYDLTYKFLIKIL